MGAVRGVLKTPVWWLVFGFATYFMSLVFQAFRNFSVLPDLANGFSLVGALVLLAATLLVLTYDSYVKEKAKGKIQHPVPLFEWMLTRQKRDVENGGA
jgi:hypothetical protein